MCIRGKHPHKRNQTNRSFRLSAECTYELKVLMSLKVAKKEKKGRSWLLFGGSIKEDLSKTKGSKCTVQYPHDFCILKIEMFVSWFLSSSSAWLPDNRLPSLLQCPPSPSSYLLSVLTYLCSSFLLFCLFSSSEVCGIARYLIFWKETKKRKLELCSILFFFVPSDEISLCVCACEYTK